MIDEIEKKILESEENYIDLDIIESIDNLLKQDSNGTYLLEFIFKNQLRLKYGLDKLLSNNPLACLIYIKNKQSISNFNLDENMLFTKIDDKYIIEYIFENNMVYALMGNIKNIENHIEIIELIIKNNDTYLLPNLSQSLINRLVTKEGNEYVIEKYLNKSVNNNLISLVDDGRVLYEIYLKTNDPDILKYANSKALLTEIAPSKNLLQILESNNIDINTLNSLKEENDIPFIKYLLKEQKYEHFEKVNENALLININDNMTLLEELLKLNIPNIPKISINNLKTIAILNKYNRLDLIKEIDKHDLLMTSIKDIGLSGDEDLLTYLKNKNITYSISSFCYQDKIVKFLYSKKDFEHLKELKTEEVFKEYTPGKLLFEEILENTNLTNLNYIVQKNPIILPILIKHNRLDLLEQMELSCLLINDKDNKTYLSTILEKIKKEKAKVLLNKYITYSATEEEKALAYIEIARMDMLEYLNELNKNELLKGKDKKLINYLLELAPELTINKIIPKKVQSDSQIAAIIKQFGLEVKDINLGESDNNYKEELFDKFNNYGIGPLQKEYFDLINELANLFLSDQKSDKILVESLINGYIQGFQNDPEMMSKEIKNLIAIKKDNPDKFLLNASNDGSYFKPLDGSVYIDRNNIPTMMHEFGHAMHYYMANTSFPDNYFDVISNVRNNKETLSKVSSFVEKYTIAYHKAKEEAKEECEKYFKDYYTKERIDEINALLSKDNQTRKEELIKLGINEETVEEISSSIFTLDNFITHQKEVFIEEYQEQKIRTEHSNYMVIGDIIDAIYRGELNSHLLSNEDGSLIDRSSGHGINYYYKDNHGFDEMIANYAEILKDNNSEAILKELKEIIGDELFELLSNYYYSNIVNKEYGKEEEKVETITR